uniref:Mce/MlaD domain-containing protein n=1 Tax=Chondria sp. (in: red algae) TaxID=1982705 RepID=A0A1Z1ME36_9FLOR|nr:hypothetical protein [Chondria sp. (in: red algae)]
MKYLTHKLNMLVLTLLFVLLVLLSKSFKNQGYNLFVEFKNAYRIRKGTIVSLQGVSIGYVSNISIRSNQVLMLLHINSIKTLVPRKSVIEANQIGLFNDTVVDITPPYDFRDKSYVDPLSFNCLDSYFMCANFYVKGYKGLNYDDLVRATTRISQRFDDPRFFGLFYLILHNLIDISDEILDCAHYITYILYLLSDLTSSFLLKYCIN